MFTLHVCGTLLRLMKSSLSKRKGWENKEVVNVVKKAHNRNLIHSRGLIVISKEDSRKNIPEALKNKYYVSKGCFFLRGMETPLQIKTDKLVNCPKFWLY